MLNLDFAWSKLFLATTEMASSDAPLAERVTQAYLNLSQLNSTNLPMQPYQRLLALRQEFARTVPTSDEDDATITLKPLSLQMAVKLAIEIVSFFDEVTSMNALARADCQRQLCSSSDD